MATQREQYNYTEVSKEAYKASTEALLELYKTTETEGLTSAQVERQLRKFGPNSLPEAPRPSLIALFLNQFRNPLIYLLLVAAGLILLLGHYTDALVTVIVVFFNTILGTIYERGAQKTLSQLQRLLTISAVVLRDGKRHVVLAQELVPGDIILVQEGDQVPADARLIITENLRVNESVFTGESASVEKSSNQLTKTVPLFEQINMIFRGTTVTAGSAVALVVATGAATQVGTLQKITQEHESETPLQQELQALSRALVVGATILCTSLLLSGLLLGKSFQELILLVVALFIGIVPEGLPVVFAIALTAAAHRLARSQVLVKRLPAAEGLGRVDTLLIDKTGTLTRNEMVVQELYIPGGHYYQVTGHGYSPEGRIREISSAIADNQTDYLVTDSFPALELLATAALLLDSSERSYDQDRKNYTIKGEPTEAALGVFAQKVLSSKPNIYTLLKLLPFDFSLRLKVGFYQDSATNDLVIFIAGSPESVLSWCTTYQKQDHTTQKALAQFLERGRRVVGLAYYRVSLGSLRDLPEQNATIESWKNYLEQYKELFTFLGFAGIEDSIRPEVKEAIDQARQAGVTILMATGDHRKTAEHIARETGILRGHERVIEGAELRRLTPEERDHLNFGIIKVFARVTPDDKLMLVEIARKQGNIVAMTGDGINDVPSLAAADIGVAMGVAGTDVAKEAADMILMDDSVVSIVKALQEGRHVFATLRRVVWYFFSTNLSEVLVIVYAFLMGLPLPLTAAQILWLNVVTDGFLDVALSLEPQESGLLSRHWFKGSGKNLFDASLVTKILLDALVMTGGVLGVYYYSLIYYPHQANTLVLVCMGLYQWFNAWNCRSEQRSLTNLGFFRNKWLIGATLLVALLQVMVVYVPFLQVLFKTTPIVVYQWGVLALIASSIILFEESRKAFMRYWISREQLRQY